MPTAHPRLTPPETLLCERCGYVIDGLSSDGGGDAACPECGTAIAASLPSRRVGTPWQRRPGLAAWAQTAGHVLRRPVGVWSAVQVQSPTWRRMRAFNLVSINCLVAALTPAALALLLGLAAAGGRRAAMGLALLGLIVFFPALWGATWLEARGIRFFGLRRGWRVDKDVAWAVCSHASFGWIFAGAGVYAALAMRRVLDPLLGLLLATPAGMLLPVGPLLAGAGWVAKACVGFVLGMLVFETIVYFGVRAMRFANGHTAGQDSRQRA